jgi:RNA polymerase sigma-70 factor (ECF subfamily)
VKEERKSSLADRRGFEQAAILHMPFLYNNALRLTMNSKEARELLQETYVNAFRLLDKVRTDTNIRGWLCRIMKNSYLNRNRMKSKDSEKNGHDERAIVSGSSGLRKSDQTIQARNGSYKAFEEDIVRRIDSLPGLLASVVVLSDVEELRYAEIAKMTNCGVDAVRSRLHRGRKVFQKSLLNTAGVNSSLVASIEGRKYLHRESVR